MGFQYTPMELSSYTPYVVCVVYQGILAVAQWSYKDGYAIHTRGAGTKLFDFIRKGPARIDELKAGLAYITQKNTDQHRSVAHKQHNRFPQRLDLLYPSLSPRTGVDILDMIADCSPERMLPLRMNADMLHDKEKCQWAYVMDLDNEVLEVFHGVEMKRHFFWNPKLTNHRFIGIGSDRATVPAFLCSIRFAEIWAMQNESQLCDKVIRHMKRFGGKPEEWEPTRSWMEGSD